MSFSYFFALFMFLGGLFGGGNDLLDHVPAEAYWKLKATPMTFDAMAAQAREANPAAVASLMRSFQEAIGKDRDNVASALIAQGDAALKPLRQLAAESRDGNLVDQAKGCVTAIETAPKGANVRRLMAIRTLGAMGKAEAVPLLEPLLRSGEPFVAEYAADAIASLHNRPAAPRPVPAAFAGDVWRLPAECRAVARVGPRAFPPGLVDGAVRQLHLPEGADEVTAVDRLTWTLVGLAERFGNVRFDGMTLGASGDLGPESGFVVTILRGRYDAAAVNRAMADDHLPYNEVAGGRVFVPGSVAVFAPSDDLLVFAAGPGGTPPADRAVAAAAAGKPGSAGCLNSSPDMVRLIGSVDTAQPLWAAVKVSDAWRGMPWLEPFDTLTLSARQRAGGTLDLKLDAHGTDPARVKAMSDAVVGQIDRVKRGLAGAGTGKPGVAEDARAALRAAAGGLLETATLSASGPDVTGAARVSASRVEIFRLLLASLKEAPKPDESR